MFDIVINPPRLGDGGPCSMSNEKGVVMTVCVRERQKDELRHGQLLCLVVFCILVIDLQRHQRQMHSSQILAKHNKRIDAVKYTYNHPLDDLVSGRDQCIQVHTFRDF